MTTISIEHEIANLFNCMYCICIIHIKTADHEQSVMSDSVRFA